MKTFMFFFLLSLSLSAQEFRVQKGIVVDSVPVNDTVSGTYAFYLPTSFEGQTPMPAMFIFDGEGRGKPAAHLLQPAAEEQGYLLISSNNITPESSPEENLKKAIVLIQEATRIFPVNMKSSATVGFAEGAKIATTLPLIFEDLNGMIYIGDRNFNGDLYKERDSLQAIGIVGDQQYLIFNWYADTQDLKEWGHNSELLVFDGGKEWPDPKFITSSVNHLTLNAMENNNWLKDANLIDQFLQRDLKLVDELLQDEEVIRAREFLSNIIQNYKYLTDVSEVKRKEKQLMETSKYQEQEKEYLAAAKEEGKLVQDYFWSLEKDVPQAQFENLGWWNYQRLLLEQKMKSENHFTVTMAKRVLNLLKVWSRDAIGYQEELEASLQVRLFTNMFATIFDQQNFDAYKKIITLSTLDGDRDTALFYLEEMLKNGYTNKEALYELEGTLGLRTSKGFNWLIKKYLGSSKYYNHETSLF